MALCRHLKFFILYFFITIITASTKYNKNSIVDLLRKKRFLLYPNPLDSETKVQILFGLGLPMEEEISMTLGYVLKCNYNLPSNVTDFTQPYIRYQRNTEEINLKNSEHDVGMTRWDLYRIFESALNSLGSGKACLLRAICEAAENEFDIHDGLLSEILYIFLKPSSTQEPYKLNEDREYHAAELIGRLSIGGCESLFPECIKSPLDYFTIFR